MNHSDYSNIRLRDCINKLDDLFNYAGELGHKIVALTDHESISGWVKAEKAAKKLNSDNAAKKQPVVHSRNSFYDEVELALNEHLSRKVKVVHGKDNGGVLEIEFYSQEDLGELAKLFDRE